MKINTFEAQLIFETTFGTKVQETAKELNFAGNSFKSRNKVDRKIGKITINDNLSTELWRKVLKQKSTNISEEKENDIEVDWKKFDINMNQQEISNRAIPNSQGNFSKGQWKTYLEKFLPNETTITADFQTREELVLEITRKKKSVWIKLPRLLNLNGIFRKGGSLYIAKWQLNESLFSATGEVELIHPFGIILQKVFNSTIVEIIDKTEIKEKNPLFLQNVINELILNKNVSEEDEGLFEFININTNDYALEQIKSLISIANITSKIPGIALVSSSANRPYKTNQLSANATISMVNGKFTIVTKSEDIFETYHTKEQLRNVFEIKSSGKRNSNTIKATCNNAYPKFESEFKVLIKF